MNRISKRKLVFVKVCSLSVFSDLQTRKKSKKKKKKDVRRSLSWVRVSPVPVLLVRVLSVRVLLVRVLPVNVLLVRVVQVQSSPVRQGEKASRAEKNWCRFFTECVYYFDTYAFCNIIWKGFSLGLGFKLHAERLISSEL